MPSFAVWGLKRPARRRETRTFTDPAQGVEVAISLRALDFPGLTAAAERGADLFESWASGFAAPDGEEVVISETLCRTVAIVHAMQCDGDGNRLLAGATGLPHPDGFSEADLVGLAVMTPGIWKELSAWAVQLANGSGEKDENFPKAASAT